MDLSDPLALARQIVENTDTNLFLTGKAGTGKTTFLRKLQSTCPKRLIVLAPTGIAAINAGGMTLHSFFQLPFSPFVPGANYVNHTFRINEQKIKLIRYLELIIIDEISMVRADVLDAVDATLKRIRRDQRPFGGVQMLLIGDLQQLAPVVRDEEWELLSNEYDSPYFFSSHSLRQTEYAIVELEKVHRQNDARFINLLNNLRTSTDIENSIRILNEQCCREIPQEADDGSIQLVTHNHQAAQINESELANLPGVPFTYKAKIEGKFPELSYPTSADLVLKKDVQVMFVKNDAQKRFFNGMIGKITFISQRGFTVTPLSSPSQSIEVSPETWENTRYTLDKDSQTIVEQREGSFTQYPVRLAWAITIHKSQGLTFDKVKINASAAFAHGQAYVALSRCRTLEGIVLTSPIPPSAIIADRHIDLFQQEVHSHSVGEKQLREMRNRYALHLVTDLFSFEKERAAFSSLVRLYAESLYHTYPKTLTALSETLNRFDTGITAVAKNFYKFYSRSWSNGNDVPVPVSLQERIRKGARYFHDELGHCAASVKAAETETDNKILGKKLKKAVEEWDAAFRIHSALLEYTAQHGFDLQAYQDERAGLLHTQAAHRTGHTCDGGKATPDSAQSQQPEVHHQTAYNKLISWRRTKMKAEGKPAYVVMQSQVLIRLANALPRNSAELSAIKGLGTQRIKAYGQELIELLAPFATQSEESKAELSDDSAPESEKQGKEATRLVSLRMFQKGMRPKDIAESRHLKESTILGHLSSFFVTGEVDFSDLMEKSRGEALLFLCRQCESVSEHKLRHIKDVSGDAFSFEEIRMALDFIKAQDGKSSD